jgi:hypothetical protein
VLLALSKSNSTPLIYFPLLGVAVDVLLRLKLVEVAPLARLSEGIKVCSFSLSHHALCSQMLQNDIISAYSSNVLMSKTAVPTYVSVRSTKVARDNQY